MLTAADTLWDNLILIIVNARMGDDRQLFHWCDAIQISATSLQN